MSRDLNFLCQKSKCLRQGILQIGILRHLQARARFPGIGVQNKSAAHNALICQCQLQLRLIHAGTPFDAALFGLVTKLRNGAATGPFVRPQTAPARG